MSDFLIPALGIAVARDSFGLDGLQNTADMPEIMGRKRTAKGHGGMYGRRDSGQFMRKDESTRDIDDVVANLAGKIIGRLMQHGVSRSEATRIAREGSRWMKEGPSAAPNFGPAGGPRFQKYGTMNEIIGGRSGKPRRSLYR